MIIIYIIPIKIELMLEELLECVPNISEGRNHKSLELLYARLRKLNQVELWNQHSDFDHNRTVLTLGGTRTGIMTALNELFLWAHEHINIYQHHGQHPRIGAIDVIPIIPLKNIAIEQCHKFIDEIGQTLSSNFHLPIYLYEKSAKSPERRNLANLRRGQIEKLAKKIKQKKWAPDFGPSVSHKFLGATALGLRDFLIAFNINLDTEDIRIAKKISRTIRESNGGLPGIKAIGIELHQQSLVQVSMNIVNFRKTSLSTVYREVVKLAERCQVKVAHTELVGLVPKAALDNKDGTEFKILNWNKLMILENHF